MLQSRAPQSFWAGSVTVGRLGKERECGQWVHMTCNPAATLVWGLSSSHPIDMPVLCILGRIPFFCHIGSLLRRWGEGLTIPAAVPIQLPLETMQLHRYSRVDDQTPAEDFTLIRHLILLSQGRCNSHCLQWRIWPCTCFFPTGALFSCHRI